MQSSTEGLLTIGDFIRWGASRFNEAGLVFGHGTDNAIDEAEQLVLAALHLRPRLSEPLYQARLTPPEREAVVGLIQRRIVERCPAPYLTGCSWFAGLEFHVDAQVLVPRSPMAELIEAAFEPWVSHDHIERILDLCTGSGCIGIAAAHYLPWTEVDLVDVSEQALAIARRNIEFHCLQERVRTIQSDLFAELAGQHYDLILCNPPYVSAAELAKLPAEYRCEPVLGLAGGESGLDVVLRILHDAGDYLNPGGTLFLEVGCSAETIEALLPEIPFVWIDFERGGAGVFTMTREQLLEYRPLFARAMESV